MFPICVYYMWLNLSFIVYPVLEKFRKYMCGGSLLTENFDIHRATSWKSFSLNNQLTSSEEILYSVLGVLWTCHLSIKLVFSCIWIGILIIRKYYCNIIAGSSPRKVIFVNAFKIQMWVSSSRCRWDTKI